MITHWVVPSNVSSAAWNDNSPISFAISLIVPSDGSQNAAAIVAAAKTIVGTTDTQVLVYVRGPMGVSKGGLVLDVTYDTAPKKAAVYAALEAKGIQCLDTI